jgi:hypothetical protein
MSVVDDDPAEPALYLIFLHGFKGNDKTFEGATCAR